MPFQKGQSGNPGGRPKEVAEIRELAKKQGPDAIKRLIHWMKSDDARASIAAATTLLDRAYGKPTQPIAGDDDAPPIQTIIRKIVDPRDTDG